MQSMRRYSPGPWDRLTGRWQPWWSAAKISTGKGAYSCAFGMACMRDHASGKLVPLKADLLYDEKAEAEALDPVVKIQKRQTSRLNIVRDD